MESTAALADDILPSAPSHPPARPLTVLVAVPAIEVGAEDVASDAEAHEVTAAVAVILSVAGLARRPDTPPGEAMPQVETRVSTPW